MPDYTNFSNSTTLEVTEGHLLAANTVARSHAKRLQRVKTVHICLPTLQKALRIKLPWIWPVIGAVV